MQQYSIISFDECYGSIGDFCNLPEEMAEEYPDIEFEFHYLEWYGDVGDEVWIYDGEQIHYRSWSVCQKDSSEIEYDEEDKFHAPKKWYADEDSFMNPHFIYIK